jgi:ATP phosphoribosyltransferase regulatory subunit
MTNRWLLPENIADVLPFEARKVEELRRAMLDVFQGYGYELVIPPMLEFRESLLTGTGGDLDLQMFKLVDQLSGRTMGIRADMTPQVARIDAHLLNRSGVTRLCYSGTTLQTRVIPGSDSREQLQVGAEIFGHSGWEADLEVMSLMLEVLSLADLGLITLDISHAGLVSELISGITLDVDSKNELYLALQSKDITSLELLTKGWDSQSRKSVLSLLDLSGEAFSVLDLAAKILPSSKVISGYLEDLRRISESLAGSVIKPRINIDLADLRGYQYHTGLMCAAYVEHLPVAIARGGRYDQVGKAFGRSRPATGFSLDIISVARLSKRDARKYAVLAPWSNDLTLLEAIKDLRKSGEVVIQLLPGHEQDAQEFQCDRELINSSGSWKVVSKKG